MKSVSALSFAIALVLTGCNELSVESLQDSLGKLNDLEDRSFGLAQLDGARRFIVVAPVHELRAVATEARSTVLPGCIGKARDALVASIDQIVVAQEPGSGDMAMAKAWKRAAAYRSLAETCERLLTA